jgi:hypothetical protein
MCARPSAFSAPSAVKSISENFDLLRNDYRRLRSP